VDLLIKYIKKTVLSSKTNEKLQMSNEKYPCPKSHLVAPRKDHKQGLNFALYSLIFDL